MVPNVLRLSASAVRDFRSCQLRYALGYVQPIPWHLRRTIDLFVLGAVVHDALAAFVRGGGAKAIPKTTLIAMLRLRWDDSALPPRKEAPALFERACSLVVTAYDMQYPRGDLRELGVERKVSWVRPRRGILAVGRLDRIVQHRNGIIEVIDLKTGREPQDTAELAEDPQSLFIRALGGEAFRTLAPRDIRLTYQYLASASVVSVDFEKEEFLAGWYSIEATASTIRQAKLAVEDGTPVHAAFPPAPGHNCRMCPFSDVCHALLEDGIVPGASLEASA